MERRGNRRGEKLETYLKGLERETRDKQRERLKETIDQVEGNRRGRGGEEGNWRQREMKERKGRGEVWDWRRLEGIEMEGNGWRGTEGKWNRGKG